MDQLKVLLFSKPAILQTSFCHPENHLDHGELVRPALCRDEPERGELHADSSSRAAVVAEKRPHD